MVNVLTPDGGDLEEGKSKATALVVLFGVIAAIFSAVETLITKYLYERCRVPGDVAGITFQLFEGIIGTLCLIVLSV